MNTDYIECGDSAEMLKTLPSESIDLVVTSPPYDNLRNYNGYTFDFETIAKELFRVVKQGGVVVWIVADGYVNGGETGTSFRQALRFMDLGFLLHDTMIWDKGNSASIGSMNRYEQVFEYMFVLSKGKPKTTNLICDKKNKRAGEIQHGSVRDKDGSLIKTAGYGKRAVKEYGRRHNVWEVFPEKSLKQRKHPAQFPVTLVKDHILSWSNAGDIVLDIFMGSGTTAVASVITGRHYIGFEISEEYVKMAKERLSGQQLEFVEEGADAPVTAQN